MPLTKRQREILSYLSDYNEINGYAPSFEEIASRFDYNSLATVHEHLTNLERKGYIKRSYNESRAIEILPSEVYQRSVELPLLHASVAFDFRLQLVGSQPLRHVRWQHPSGHHELLVEVERDVLLVPIEALGLTLSPVPHRRVGQRDLPVGGHALAHRQLALGRARTWSMTSCASARRRSCPSAHQATSASAAHTGSRARSGSRRARPRARRAAAKMRSFLRRWAGV